MHIPTLIERTPRPWTWAYFICEARAVIRHQLPVGLPVLAGAYYALAGAQFWGAAGLPTGPWSGLRAAAAAGIPAGLGALAVWRWISARLYPWLDAHPQGQSGIESGYRLPPRPEFAEPTLILGECHAERSYKLNGDYSLKYSVSASYSATPEWSILPARSLVTGLLVLGGIGSGKTAYILRPAIFGLFAHPSRPGGLVMDSKAMLVDTLFQALSEAGREADFLPIGPRSSVKWNPLHSPLSSPSTVANSILTALENLNGAPYGSDSRWIRSGAAHVAEGCIGLLRLLTNYVTAQGLRLLLAELALVTAGHDTPAQSAGELVDTFFSSTDVPRMQAAEFEYYKGLIQSRFGEDEKFRTIYLSELLNILIPLTAPDILHLYNAPEAELNFPGWASAINTGLVICLDCNARTNPGLSTILGMLLKLGYEDALLARLDWAKQGLCDMSRYMLLCIDEYQDFCSPGDSDYLALCRESKSMTFFLTQGHASIVQRVGLERTTVILQSMRNRLILAQDLPDESVKLLGKDEAEELSRNISESTQDAALGAGGRFVGQSTVSESLTVSRREKDIVPAAMIRALPVGQGILQCHTGMRAVPVHRVFFRPYFDLDSRCVDRGVQ